MSAELKTKLEAVKAECRQTIALAEKAASGVWVADHKTHCQGFHVTCGQYGSEIADTGWRHNSKQDASFIAHARNTAAKQAHALLTSIEALESMVFPDDYCDNDGRGCMACEKAFQTLEAIARDWEELK